ncbi:hypothetical protein [Caldanaerobius fijiensis]|uniref:hypothetical protein n=1 Tax=Caldanaerobius fijiensis TaxID=456330 RepID=UPI001160663F|nr:hypothetical protein [Caldanaerobius fijiensis]
MIGILLTLIFIEYRQYREYKKQYGSIDGVLTVKNRKGQMLAVIPVYIHRGADEKLNKEIEKIVRFAAGNEQEQVELKLICLNDTSRQYKQMVDPSYSSTFKDAIYMLFASAGKESRNENTSSNIAKNG